MSAKPEPFWIARIAAGQPARLRGPGESVDDYRIAMGWDKPKDDLPEPFATLHDDGHWTMKPGNEPYKSRFAGWRADVYSAEQMRAALGVKPSQAQSSDGCEHCGGKVSSYSHGCPGCGAPVCCQRCCDEANEQAASGVDSTRGGER